MANGNFEGTVEKHTVHAHALEAAARDSVLMVRSFKSPYSVPYPEYIEELRERNGSISEEAEVALAAIREHVGPEAMERAESLKLG